MDWMLNSIPSRYDMFLSMNTIKPNPFNPVIRKYTENNHNFKHKTDNNMTENKNKFIGRLIMFSAVALCVFGLVWHIYSTTGTFMEYGMISELLMTKIDDVIPLGLWGLVRHFVPRHHVQHVAVLSQGIQRIMETTKTSTNEAHSSQKDSCHTTTGEKKEKYV